MTELTLDNFDREVLQSKQPVLVDFWASWCAPCRMLAPVIEEIDKAGGVAVGKVNVDEQIELATRYNVTSIPTVALFRDGEIAATSVGFRPKEDILKLLD